MPAPKNPNTTRATEIAAERRNAERDQRDAERLRDRGWLPLDPDQLAALPAELRAQLDPYLTKEKP